MFEEGKSTNRIVHVGFPYTLRRSTSTLVHTLSMFFYHACRVYEIFIDRLFFFSVSFLWVRRNRNDTRAWSEMKPKAWLQFKTRTRISTVWLPMESDCLSIADFSSRQLGFVDAHKTYTKSCSPVMLARLIRACTRATVKVKNGENCNQTDPSTLQFPRCPV